MQTTKVDLWVEIDRTKMEWEIIGNNEKIGISTNQNETFVMKNWNAWIIIREERNSVNSCEHNLYYDLSTTKIKCWNGNKV